MTTDHDSETGPGCDRTLSRLALRAAGGLDAAQDDEVSRHLARCAACRAASMAGDPASLFLELRGGPLPPEIWTGFDQELRRRIEAAQDPVFAPARIWEALGAALRPPRVAYVAAPLLAMVMVLGVTMMVMRPAMLGPGPRASRPEDGLRSPYAPPVIPRRDGARAERAIEALPALVSDLKQVEPPPLEEVTSPAARVYRLDVEGRDATPIYMVVDETIDF